MGVVQEYAASTDKPLPLASYGAFVGLYVILFGPIAEVFVRRKGTLKPLKRNDFLLLAPATHKLTRLITKDWVTSPLRAPFTEYKGSKPAGEVKELSRGTGLRRAVGDLVTCAYCMAPWVAGAFVTGIQLAPESTRRIASILALSSATDYLHFTFEGLRDLKRLPGKAVEAAERKRAA